MSEGKYDSSLHAKALPCTNLQCYIDPVLRSVISTAMSEGKPWISQLSSLPFAL